MQFQFQTADGCFSGFDEWNRIGHGIDSRLEYAQMYKLRAYPDYTYTQLLGCCRISATLPHCLQMSLSITSCFMIIKCLMFISTYSTYSDSHRRFGPRPIIGPRYLRFGRPSGLLSNFQTMALHSLYSARTQYCIISLGKFICCDSHQGSGVAKSTPILTPRTRF